jgi:hypothetical protein
MEKDSLAMSHSLATQREYLRKEEPAGGAGDAGDDDDEDDSDE